MALPRKIIAQYTRTLTDLYADLEDDLVRMIAGHFNPAEEPQAMEEWHAARLAEMGGLRKDVIARIARTAHVAPAEVQKAYKAMGLKCLEADERVYRKARAAGILKGVTVPAGSSRTFKKIMKQAISSSQNYLNMVNTRANISSNREYMRIVNKVYIESVTGVRSYHDAVRTAVLQFADRGVTGVQYISRNGRTTEVPIDAAVWRMAQTRGSQLAGEIQLNRAQEEGSNFVEVSSHFGARPSHAVWQGKVYQLDGNDRYPNFYEATGYGTGGGLKGYNCQHDFYPFIPGLSSHSFFAPDIDANNAAYENQEQQRGIENDIRKAKRQAIAADRIGDDEATAERQQRVSSLQAKMRTLVNENDLARDSAREQVPGYSKIGK